MQRAGRRQLLAHVVTASCSHFLRTADYADINSSSAVPAYKRLRCLSAVRVAHWFAYLTTALWTRTPRLRLYRMLYGGSCQTLWTRLLFCERNRRISPYSARYCLTLRRERHIYASRTLCRLRG